MKDVRAERIVGLLNEMRSSGVPFNAWVHGPTRVDAGGDKYRDCAALALADNGEGWEAVSESGNGLYDLWFRGELREANLSRVEAAQKMLTHYTNSKIARVGNRLSGQN